VPCNVDGAKVPAGGEDEAQSGRSLKVVKGVHVGGVVLWESVCGGRRELDGEVAQGEEHAKHCFLVVDGSVDLEGARPLAVAQTGAAAVKQVEGVDGHRTYRGARGGASAWSCFLHPTHTQDQDVDLREFEARVGGARPVTNSDDTLRVTT
jgi:hypothetical protein